MKNIFKFTFIFLLLLDIYTLIFIDKRFGFENVIDIITQFVILIPLFFMYRQQVNYSKKLVDSEQRYKSLFLYKDAGIYVINGNGTVDSISPNLSESLGYSEAELTGQSFSIFFAPEDVPMIQQMFLEIVKGNTISSSRKMKIRNKSGQNLVFDFSSVALMVDGEIQGVIGFAKDITELDRAQEKLSEVQTQMNNIFQSIDIVLWSLDVIQQKRIILSDACEKILGYTLEEHYSNPNLWTDRVHDDDKELVIRRMTGIYKGSSSYDNIEYRLVHLNGEIRWVESRIFPVIDSNNRLVGINGLMIDITDKKMIEENHRIDLDLARQVQKSVLSKPIYTPVFSIDARYVPSQELGGDMYAWYRIDEHRYGILIMDVMGHGVSSSLICMSIRALLRGIIQFCSNPEDVIKELNDHMNKLFSEAMPATNFFFTAIYLIADHENNCIEYINAGHPSGLLMETSGEIHTLESTGIPIGLMLDLNVTTKIIQLNGPARLILYTDGLIENPGVLMQEQVDSVKSIMVETKLESMTIVMDKLIAFSNINKQEVPDDVCLICMDICSEKAIEDVSLLGYLI
ncbi:SpoIIE family protein phosphatase [Paenibacillus sp. 19GGS1-52]|uniref:SpoIIE family protein phosphatase n=1 Tax=Paenibacillus sp. 19GGS1-52 TaxID=2758563 RepID=UPI001EFB6ABE|nr:SpoIIE family protein phosphatase [Paenibacillus sp. 19GGS1-52]ULO06788.1 SpoIIE family protein phosphatase [Paenibacillus sp. 19GGS1-52]